MKRRHLPVWMAAVALAVAVPLGVARAEAGERITDFASVATLSKSSSLDVVETITYDFGAGSKHGIYRDIPIAYRNADGTQYRPAVEFVDATQDGAPATVAKTSSDTTVRLKIGDADKSISGTHVYRIHYAVGPIMRPGDGHDVFGFNVTGNGWDVPIESASMRLILPSGGLVLDSNCYTGPSGSKGRQCSVAARGDDVVVQTSAALAPGEGLSYFADLPTGAITGYAQAYVQPKISPLAWILVALGAASVLLGFIQMAIIGLRERKLRRSRTIVAEYEPPDGLHPAELGLLTDDRSGMPEISATLIDLAVRGHIRIEQTKAKTLLRGAAYTFHRLSSDAPIEPFEERLLDALFGTHMEIKLTDVDHGKMSAAVESFHTEVGGRMKTRGWYHKAPSAWRWWGPAILLVIAIIVTAYAAGAVWQFRGSGAATWGVAGGLALGAVTTSALAVWLLRRPSGMTPEGADEWAKVRGFREYLNVAEKARLDFSDAPEKTPERFNRLLPYAVALGVAPAWAKQFEGIDVARASGWYTGYNPAVFNAAYLASSLNSDFSKGVASGFAPVSSSGSSSGGFSGGGFGGGGGGSW